ncbi:DUF1385 domain-containing protein [Finegoldia magna]|uniref:DUF1385 domain-containing protein n=1 Tax=Finegoldia magna TaxID=1260 RepID=UPI002903B624|nr:DUF1385 domain-containing protein [Finegoldia magna]MDU2219416.1 DUF1385 domain-containing protein [Finegoldia magna]
MKKTTIGGQALIEGILMRGPSKYSIAVRKPDQEIDLVVKDLENNIINLMKIPFIRGIVSLFDSMKLGMDALMYSASFYEDDSENFFDKHFKNNARKVENVFSIIASVALALLFFFFIPTFLTSFVKLNDSSFSFNLIEGLIRIIIFFTYLFIVSHSKDMKRVFEYHGAEHKSIYCYEQGLDLTVENVRKQSRLHPRCGTSFLFTVMIISILVLSLVGWPNPLMRMMYRIILLPVIVSISYEINRLIGKYDNTITALLVKPGLWVQKFFTVREPDDKMIEVAILALKSVIPEKEDEDLW